MKPVSGVRPRYSRSSPSPAQPRHRSSPSPGVERFRILRLRRPSTAFWQRLGVERDHARARDPDVARRLAEDPTRLAAGSLGVARGFGLPRVHVPRDGSERAFYAALPRLHRRIRVRDSGARHAGADDRRRDVTEGVRRSFPRRTIAIYTLTFGVLLAAAWLKDIVTRMAAGQLGWPDAYGSVRNVVQALDLGLQVPLLLASGLLLLRRRSTGYLVAAIATVHALCMGAALAAMVGWSSVTEGKSLLVAAPFVAVFLVTLCMALLFFRNSDRAERRHGELSPMM